MASGPHRLADGQSGMVQGLAHDRRRGATRPRRRWNWKCWCAGCSSSAGFSTCSSISSSSRKTRTATGCTRSSRATTSSTRSTRRWRRPCGPAAWWMKISCARTRARIGRAGCTAASRATGAPAWSGTRRAAARVFRCSSMPARIVRHPAMQNPTLVVLTDRNDLDDQLFGQFQRCHEFLRQTPVQANDREHLRELLQVASGGVVFTTIQKFMPEKGEKMPELSPRRNIIVIADEAHRSQYDLIDGLARHCATPCPMPRSSASPARPSRRTTPTRGRSSAITFQHLRHPARRGRQGHGADLLREPHRQAGAERGRAAQIRRGVRGDHRGRGRGQEAEAQDQMGRAGGAWSATRSASPSSPPTWWSTTSGGWRRWTARR